MRSDNYQKNNIPAKAGKTKSKIKILPGTPGLTVLLVAFLLIEVTFMSMLTILNILPTL